MFYKILLWQPFNFLCDSYYLHKIIYPKKTNKSIVFLEQNLFLL